MKQHLSKFITAPVLAIIAIGAFTAAAQAGVIVDNPLLPSLQGGTGPGSATDIPTGLPTGYLTPAEVHAMYSGPGLAVVLSQVQHQPFSLIDRHPDGMGGQIETFQSVLDAMGSINNGPTFPIHATGPVTTHVLYGGGGPTGAFATEMLSLDLNAGSGVMIRESPTLQSTGQTVVQPVGGGLFHIDSFFDVFTELSLDNGASWMPSSGPTHVTLEPVPEPGTLLWGAALGIFAGARRVRNRRA